MCYFGERKFYMNVGKLLNRRAPLILSNPTLLFTYGKKAITTQEKENRNPKTERDIANYENFNLLNELWYR